MHHTSLCACLLPPRWVNQKKTSCPVCRKPIDESDDAGNQPPPPRQPCSAGTGFETTEDMPGTYTSTQQGASTSSWASQEESARRQQRLRLRGRMRQEDVLHAELMFRLMSLRRWVMRGCMCAVC